MHIQHEELVLTKHPFTVYTDIFVKAHTCESDGSFSPLVTVTVAPLWDCFCREDILLKISRSLPLLDVKMTQPAPFSPHQVTHICELVWTNSCRCFCKAAARLRFVFLVCNIFQISAVLYVLNELEVKKLSLGLSQGNHNFMNPLVCYSLANQGQRTGYSQNNVIECVFAHLEDYK